MPPAGVPISNDYLTICLLQGLHCSFAREKKSRSAGIPKQVAWIGLNGYHADYEDAWNGLFFLLTHNRCAIEYRPGSPHDSSLYRA
jgi:hypothetical protein